MTNAQFKVCWTTRWTHGFVLQNAEGTRYLSSCIDWITCSYEDIRLLTVLDLKLNRNLTVEPFHLYLWQAERIKCLFSSMTFKWSTCEGNRPKSHHTMLWEPCHRCTYLVFVMFKKINLNFLLNELLYFSPPQRSPNAQRQCWLTFSSLLDFHAMHHAALP